ncbi:ABC transporter permease [uncultured Piscinibacter sp.]|uniref:ABC transporter permease n=1 Tax=uncultured Piscinibacter sp. TaxID=1131835 RepID=UPI002632E5FC|nr:ABC transporter permease [uncultured Piscinibacter sp.]
MKRSRVVALARKEWREMLRDRVYLLLAFALPVVLMLVFGHGMSQEVEHVGLAVLDEDRSASSRSYIDHFTKTRHFRFLGALHSHAQIEPLLATGGARVILRIGPGFARELHRGGEARVQFIVDGTFTAPARTLRGYVEAINAAASAEIRASALSRLSGRPIGRTMAAIEPVRLQVRYLYNEEVRSIWTVAPSLLMLILLMVPPLLLAVSVVREKETGAIYNVRCSTLTRAEFMAGKLLPSLAVSCVNALLLWAVTVVYFGVPFKGSAWVLALGSVLYLLGTSALGLLISLLVRSQQAAIIIATITASIVAIQFSGLFAPVESMQGANQWLARVLPASHYREIAIGTFLKRSDLETLLADFAWIAGFALVVLGLCLALFRKRTAS